MVDRDEINEYLKTQEAIMLNLEEMLRNVVYRNLSYSADYTDKEKRDLWNCIDSIIGMIKSTSVGHMEWARQNVEEEVMLIARTLYRKPIEYLYGKKTKRKKVV